MNIPMMFLKGLTIIFVGGIPFLEFADDFFPKKICFKQFVSLHR